MALDSERKSKLIQEFRTHESDTGSPDVQVALLTERIGTLSEHLKLHKRDHSSRRALLMMVGKRSALLKYLKGTALDRYSTACEKLGIRS